MSGWLERFVEEVLEGREMAENKCQLCRLEHLGGKQHQRALLGEEATRLPGCKVCHVEYLDVSHMKRHLSSKSHQTNMKGTWKVRVKKIKARAAR